jgi:cytochrome c-type biogenesis protein CcmF
VTPLLGRSLVLVSLLLAGAGAVTAFAAGRSRSPVLWLWTRRIIYAFAAAMGAANLLMVWALLRHDFSVGYVAHVGSRLVPDWVSVVSLWSSLEGSILFWGLVLGAYLAAATYAQREAPLESAPYSAGVWMVCAAFFALLIAGPAQPFTTVSPVPADGPGPNPLLQNHVLMIIHPPFLYLGYVGMTIPFGLACGALLSGRLGRDQLLALRRWLLMPWIFLTVAIVLGGWWAYEVLGWGGYWAWDPVENASFMPWLTATAALHSALLTERRGVLKGWTTTLVLASFLLTILGTFMTRSGVFNSVHSFTQSAIGPTILVFLAAALLFSVGLLAARIDRLSADEGLGPAMTREGMFLVNNLLFVLFTFTVLIGTVFPLVVEALRKMQMSVGRPFFDRMSVPIGVALLVLMGIGPALPWGRSSRREMARALLPPLVSALVVLAIGFALGVRAPWTLATLAGGGYTAHVTLAELVRPLRQRFARGEALARAASEGLLGRARRRTGGYVAHAGFVIIVIAIAVSSTMGQSREVVLRQGESVNVGRYTVTFLGLEQVSEPHRDAMVATLSVYQGQRNLGVMTPRMNQYPTQREPVGTPAVRTSLREDLYLSIMNADPAQRTLGVLIRVNPMVVWVWIATAIMALGGVMALVPRRRPVVATVSAPSPVVPPGAAAAR